MNDRQRKVSVEFVDAQTPVDLRLIAVAIAEKIKREGLNDDRRTEIHSTSKSNC